MNYLKLAILGIIIISSVSCNTTGESEYAELSPEEYQRLVAKVRSYIKTLKTLPRSENQNYKYKDNSVLKNVVPAEDQVFINKNEPKFIVYYYGHKAGEFRMIWRITPSYSVKVTGKGEFLKDNCKLRLTISRFAQ